LLTLQSGPIAELHIYFTKPKLMLNRPLRTCTNLKLTDAQSTYPLFFLAANSLRHLQWPDVDLISNLEALLLQDFAVHLYHPGEDPHHKTSDLKEIPIHTGQDPSRARARQDDTEVARDLTRDPDPRQEDEVVDVATAQDEMEVVGEDVAGAIAVIVVMTKGVEADPEIEGGAEDVKNESSCVQSVTIVV